MEEVWILSQSNAAVPTSFYKHQRTKRLSEAQLEANIITSLSYWKYLFIYRIFINLALGYLIILNVLLNAGCNYKGAFKTTVILKENSKRTVWGCVEERSFLGMSLYLRFPLNYIPGKTKAFNEQTTRDHVYFTRTYYISKAHKSKLNYIGLSLSLKCIHTLMELRLYVNS